ncbi:TonB family protein [Phocaeicola salanitronis DSM 18170]|uniref:TonB family protein n=1 Tax=Phocaeicola salanitronis (strain DSM 18170 / JCM 13657 / CCUG 60908 / BL78) TaxID=667015 RepID=F0R573_PHOSB|nr:M56 family metallopeptidase [Phocaeicola salanitronis]ADY37827.1 TonB family protein [Phocaeicola salanitronis DSM 18170]
MGLFFIYILKASVCLALFYLFYKVLLSKETFHRFNRLALLGILVLSCLLPAVKIAISEPTALNQTVSDLESLLMLAELNAGTEAAETVSRFGWQEAMVGIYLAGVSFFCLKSLFGIGRICTVIRRNRKERLADGSILVRYPGKIAPFSWMHYIVMPDTDLQEDNRAIVAHEQAHIRLRHSWDLLLAQACIVVQWFNPAAWLVKQELQNIHEYEADEAVLASGVNAKEYQLLLIKKAVGSRLYSLANSLNHSSLKKRITMMMRKKSNPWARAKYLYVLPLAAVAVAAFARPEISKPLEEISRVKVTEFPAISDAVTSESIEKNDTLKDNEEEPYTAVEQMPQFPGGPSELMKYISANLRYPEDAKRDKTEGRVIARFTVKKDGSIGDVNIVRGVSPSLDAEAVRVLSGMPRWEPGMQNGKAVPTLYTVPVVFRIIEDGKQDSTEVALAPKPLVLVDGKEYTGSLDAIDPQSIERIDVLKDPSSTETYGEKGKNGVILVTTKKK